MSVIGSISIRDNASAVLRNLKKEQSAFRKDVSDTKKELTQTWSKSYKARLDATAANRKMQELKKTMQPLRKKLVTAIAVKDAATEKIKGVAKRIKNIGKLTAKPVVSIAVKGAQALGAVGKGIAGAAKFAAVGLGAVGAAGAAALKAVFNGSTEAAKAQIEAETKLEAVLGNVVSIQERGPGAAQEAKKNLMGVASSLQQVGVIGDEVTLAGMQQLATFQLSDKAIGTLSGGMTDLLAQQKGLNATQEDAVNIGNLIGKAMQGQTGALSRVGITFDEAQEKALKTGDAEQRAAVLADILQQNVGGVNKALAETDQGKIQQMSNAYGDMKEEVGKLALSLKAKVAGVVMKNIPTIQKLGTTMVGTISQFADRAIPVLDKVISNAVPVVESVLSGIGSLAEQMAPVASGLFGGMHDAAIAVLPALGQVAAGFGPLIPVITEFATNVSAAMSQAATAAMPVITSIIETVQNVLPALIPVIGTVITTISGVITQAAPIISGLVTGIGTVVSTLAPIFSTIFSEIGEKVGSVLSFVGERMGFIQEVIGTVAPLIGDIISTAWSVISPVIDIAVNAFKLVFSVVQKVFPGVKAVIESVWNFIKPIVEGIGSVLGTIADGIGWVADKFSGSGGDKKGKDKKAGKNASGDNNWRGGVTWVGENGPELIELPRGTRILPNKESVSLNNQEFSGKSVIQGISKKANSRKDVKLADSGVIGGSSIINVLQIISQDVKSMAASFHNTAAQHQMESKAENVKQRMISAVHVSIAKLADSIVVREDADIDRIADAVAKKVIAVVNNMP